MKKNQKVPKPILQVLIRQDTTKIAHELFVYETKEEMQRGISSHPFYGKDIDSANCDAMFVSGDRTKFYYNSFDNKVEELLTMNGALFFHKKGLYNGMVAHECFHATLNYDRKFLNSESPTQNEFIEEHNAYFMTELINAITATLDKYKLEIQGVAFSSEQSTKHYMSDKYDKEFYKR